MKVIDWNRCIQLSLFAHDGDPLGLIPSGTSGIYRIRNLVNHCRYIGSSCNVRERLHDHRNRLRRGIHNNKHLQRAFNKYGENRFEFLLIEECEESKLLEREQSYLPPEKTYRALKLRGFYNAVPIAGRVTGIQFSVGEIKRRSDRMKGNQNLKGYVPSEETRRKLSMAGKKSPGLKGQKMKEETKRKISQTTKGRPGRPQSEESKRKISAKATGRKVSEETRQKLSKARKGKPLSEKNRRGISDALKGKQKSPEHLERMRESRKGVATKISAALKGKPKSPEHLESLRMAAAKRRKKP